MKEWASKPKQMLLSGLIVSAAAYLVWALSGSALAAAILILVGAFSLPMAVMVWLYQRLDKIPWTVLANCFMVGGAMGLIIAGTLEMSFPTGRSFSGYIGIGLIEETAKIAFPLILFMTGRYRSLSSGLLIGICSGMGFAVMETIGRGLVDLINGTQDVGYTMLTRGFFTPAGHPAWTGLICAVLWKARIKADSMAGARVMGTFVLAVMLHATWNTLNRINVPDYITALMLTGMSVLILWLVFLQFEQAQKERVDV